jgi:hypothetical protein
MADAIIARMFYTRGLPFNLVRNLNYREAFNFTATNSNVVNVMIRLFNLNHYVAKCLNVEPSVKYLAHFYHIW